MAYVPPAHFTFGNFGGLNFIIQDNQAFALAMQNLINVGSDRDNIGINQIQAICDQAGHENPGSVAEAVSWGMRFFDAMIYFILPVNLRPAITVSVLVPPVPDRASNVIATKLFFIAFYLMTRGTIPQSNDIVAGPNIPALLANTYQMNISPNQLVADLSGFNMRRLNNQWIRYINWTQLNVIPRNRFGLGVAGYRAFSPFKLLPAEDTVQNGINIALPARNLAFQTAVLIATQPADWNIHPITRNPTVMTALGPLNGNLQNLMLACYSQQTLALMTNQRIIYAVPTYNARFTNFMNWTPALVTFLNDPIIMN